LPVVTGTQLKEQLPQKINSFGDHFASPKLIHSVLAGASPRQRDRNARARGRLQRVV